MYVVKIPYVPTIALWAATLCFVIWPSNSAEFVLLQTQWTKRCGTDFDIFDLNYKNHECMFTFLIWEWLNIKKGSWIQPSDLVNNRTSTVWLCGPHPHSSLTIVLTRTVTSYKLDCVVYIFFKYFVLHQLCGCACAFGCGCSLLRSSLYWISGRGF